MGYLCALPFFLFIFRRTMPATKTIFAFFMLTSLPGVRCSNTNTPPLGSGPGLYYILEKESSRSNKLVIARQCDLHTYLTYNDTMVEIGYHVAVVNRFKIDHITQQGRERTIFCKGEYPGPGYLDTTVTMDLHLKAVDSKSLQTVMRYSDLAGYLKTDTFFITPASFIDKFKVVDWECEKKVKE
ncbi:MULTISPECIES: hypothetical protein [Niastella]|uniref:Uncharacterized protein n=1 Tax=Niastella soli TaxID=2821487 RepID=A0ABS3YW35_9BACT|nr:hypothetical protein [Niastella soli]MBO9202144.1 hypothetical protein [Niastella soli]